MSIQNLKTVARTIFKEHWALSSVLLWSGLICFLSLTYITVGITLWSSLVIAAFFLCAYYFLLHPLLPRFQLIPKRQAHLIAYAAVILADVALAFIAWNARTDAALQSPWSQLPWWFIACYALATMVLLLSLWREDVSALSLAATITHIGLFYSIALLVFRFGYAYDPLIHQAAENYVAQHGKISPLQPFYIGQYALVAFVHFLTHAPVWLIDRLLLPFLAIISLPILSFIGFTRGWKLPRAHAQIATVAFLTTIPLAELTFTVPHNVAVLLLLWWIVLLPFALQSRAGKITLFFLALAATTFHPLVGIPLCIASLLACTLKRFPLRKIAIIGSLIIGMSLLTMLGIYRIQHGETFVVTLSPVTYSENFFNLFYFTRVVQEVRPALQMLYGLAFLIPFIISFGAIYAAIKNRTVEPVVRWTLFALSVGILCGIFSISTLISIPGIVGYEQNEFVLRLKNILPIILLPFAVIIAISYAEKKPNYSKIIFVGITLLSTMNLYFTYPRADGVSNPGWNVSRGDIEVVRTIPQLSQGKPYVVLSNQILAVAGLRELGFDHRLVQKNGTDTYPYSIGMSEQIYPLSQQVLYQELNGVNVRTLAQLIQGSVFIAVHDYWYRADQIADEARTAGANATYQFDGITVYEFK